MLCLFGSNQRRINQACTMIYEDRPFVSRACDIFHKLPEFCSSVRPIVNRTKALGALRLHTLSRLYQPENLITTAGRR